MIEMDLILFDFSVVGCPHERGAETAAHKRVEKQQ